MGLFEYFRTAYKGAVEPEALAEELIGRPWTVSVDAISASSKVREDFREAWGGDESSHGYRLERVTVVNNNGSIPILVRPNADGNREVRIGAGGGSAVIDHGSIDYLEIENTSGTTATSDGDIVLYGEAFKRH